MSRWKQKTTTGCPGRWTAKEKLKGSGVEWHLNHCKSKRPRSVCWFAVVRAGACRVLGGFCAVGSIVDDVGGHDERQRVAPDIQRDVGVQQRRRRRGRYDLGSKARRITNCPADVHPPPPVETYCPSSASLPGWVGVYNTHKRRGGRICPWHPGGRGVRKDQVPFGSKLLLG